MPIMQILTLYAADGKTVLDQQRVSGVRALPVPAGWTDTTADPAVVYIPPNPAVIASGAFLARFTAAEQTAIQTAAFSNAAVALGLTMGLAAGEIDLLSATTQAWVNGLVAGGLLTSARATAILTP